ATKAGLGTARSSRMPFPFAPAAAAPDRGLSPALPPIPPLPRRHGRSAEPIFPYTLRRSEAEEESGISNFNLVAAREGGNGRESGGLVRLVAGIVNDRAVGQLHRAARQLGGGRVVGDHH